MKNVITIYGENNNQKSAGFEEKTENLYSNGHTSALRDFVQSIEDDIESYIDAYVGKRAVELILAIYKSSSERMIFKLLLNNCSSLDFKYIICFN
ncbi:MAG: hypothetical protein R3Y54_13855, partial [Eubacteriales bacterium]